MNDMIKNHVIVQSLRITRACLRWNYIEKWKEFSVLPFWSLDDFARQVFSKCVIAASVISSQPWKQPLLIRIRFHKTSRQKYFDNSFILNSALKHQTPKATKKEKKLKISYTYFAHLQSLHGKNEKTYFNKR